MKRDAILNEIKDLSGKHRALTKSNDNSFGVL